VLSKRNLHKIQRKNITYYKNGHNNYIFHKQTSTKDLQIDLQKNTYDLQKNTYDLQKNTYDLQKNNTNNDIINIILNNKVQKFNTCNTVDTTEDGDATEFLSELDGDEIIVTDFTSQNYKYYFQQTLKNNQMEQESKDFKSIISQKWFVQLLIQLKKYKQKIANKVKMEIPIGIYKLLHAIQQVIVLGMEFNKEILWKLIDGTISFEDFKSNLVYTILQHIFDVLRISCEEYYLKLKKHGIQPPAKLLQNVRKLRKVKAITAQLSANPHLNSTFIQHRNRTVHYNLNLNNNKNNIHELSLSTNNQINKQQQLQQQKHAFISNNDNNNNENNGINNVTNEKTTESTYNNRSGGLLSVVHEQDDDNDSNTNENSSSNSSSSSNENYTTTIEKIDRKTKLFEEFSKTPLFQSTLLQSQKNVDNNDSNKKNDNIDNKTVPKNANTNTATSTTNGSLLSNTNNSNEITLSFPTATESIASIY